MDPTKITYHNDTEGHVSLVNQRDFIFNSDHLSDEIYDCESSSVEDDYYLVDFSSFKDVARSKKFYLKKKDLDETKLDEFEDVFRGKTTEDETDSEEEKIIQVVWSEDDPVQNKLVRFVEALEMKKSNSKFTLSMLDEERVSADVDSCEGEDIKGRFLEVKDSLEVLATSSRNLHGSKYSDWDFSVDEDDQEVNRIWRKSDSPWTSSLQIEIGKLPSQADQETVLQVLDEGAQGRISVRDVTECLGNLLDSVNQDKDEYPTKKVSFCAVPSKSCLSRESLSQTSTQSGRSSSHKKVSFYTEITEDDISDEIADKTTKRVSFYELAYDDDAEALIQSDNGKIKKSVSFHDSVEFEKSKECDGFPYDGSPSEANADVDSTSSTGRSCNSDKIVDFYIQEDMSNHSGVEKSTTSDTAASGVSLGESFSTYSTHTSLEDSIDVSECRDISDTSLHSSNQEEDAVPLHLLKFLNDQINNLAENDVNEIDSGVGIFSESSKGTVEKSDVSSDSFKKLLMEVKNDVKSSIHDIGLKSRMESRDDKIDFIRSLIEDSLNKKFDQNDCSKVLNPTKNELLDTKEPLISGIGKTFKLFYDHCKEIVDLETLSKSMGLAMAFQDLNQIYKTSDPNEIINHEDLNSLSTLPLNKEFSSQESNNDCSSSDIAPTSSIGQYQLDDAYMSADSDGELQANELITIDSHHFVSETIYAIDPSNKSPDGEKSGISK